MNEISSFNTFQQISFFQTVAKEGTVVITQHKLDKYTKDTFENLFQYWIHTKKIRSDILSCILVDESKGLKTELGANTHEGPGYSPENGIRVCAALKTPFSCPPDHSLRSPFQRFSILKTLKSQIYGKFAFQSLKLGKFQLSLKFGHLSVVEPHIGQKISSLRPQIWW